MTDWTKPAAYEAGLDNVKPRIVVIRRADPPPFDPYRPLRSMLWPRLPKRN